MFDDKDLSQLNYNNTLKSRLEAAYKWQLGGPAIPYVDMRILEKKGMLYVYRDHNTIVAHDVNGQTIQRPRIKGVILMYRGRLALGLTQERTDS